MEFPNRDTFDGKLYEAVALYYRGATLQDKILGKTKLENLALAGDLETNLRLAIVELGESNINGVDRLHRLAAKGYMPAFYELGNVYYFGFDDLEDKRKGLSYWSRAAGQGHLYAKLNALKVRSQNEKLNILVINVLRIWALTVKLAILTVRNKNDERILGVTPSYWRSPYS